jgi:hypothetical protein
MAPAIQICCDHCARYCRGLGSGWTRFVRSHLRYPTNQAHRDLLSRDAAHREELYARFIIKP